MDYQENFNCICYSSDGKLIANGFNTVLKIYNSFSNSLIKNWTGH